jgi:hypothetical protein
MNEEEKRREEEEERREQRKEMVQHLQSAAELALGLSHEGGEEDWLSQCVWAWNLAVSDTGSVSIAEDCWLLDKEAAAQIRDIDWESVGQERREALGEDEEAEAEEEGEEQQ